MQETPHTIVHSISTGTIVKTILILIAFALLFYVRDIILILLTSVVLASAIEPGTRFLVRRGIPRIAAVIILYVILLIAILALTYLILPSFISDLAGFMTMLPKNITALNVKTGSESGNGFLNWQSTILGLSKSESLEEAVRNLTTSISNANSGVLATLSAIFGGLTSLVLIIVVSFYLSVQERGIERFLRLVTPLHKEEYVISLWRRTQHKIGRWMQGQLLLALIVGVLVFIGLTILKVEHAFFLALISTIFEIIPVFGPIVGSIPGIITGFLQGGFAFGVIIALMYLVIQQIESNVIYPLVVRKVLDIHPLVVIIALIVGVKLGGVLGVLLSVPLAVALTEYLTDISKNRIAAREKFSAEPVK